MLLLKECQHNISFLGSLGDYVKSWSCSIETERLGPTQNQPAANAAQCVPFIDLLEFLVAHIEFEWPQSFGHFLWRQNPQLSATEW